jgi:hypothetical protein
LKSEIQIIKKQLLLLLENQEKITTQLEDIKLKKSNEQKWSINISKNECMSDNASINTFSPIMDENYISNSKNQCYDELLIECYDVIPMNNLKKNTGMSWLLN